MPDEERRSALKLIGVGSIAGLAGLGYGLAKTPTIARAEGSMKLPSTVQAYTDSGKLKHVAIWGQSKVVWRGFEVTAEYFEIDVTLHITDGDGDPVYSSVIHTAGPESLNRDDWGDSLDQLSGAGKRGRILWTWGLDDELERDPSTDWHIIGSDPDDHGAPSNPAPADVVYVPKDHDRETFTIRLEMLYRWYDGNPEDSGEEIYAEAFDDSFKLRVNNVIAHAEGGTSVAGGVEAVADNTTTSNGS